MSAIDPNASGVAATATITAKPILLSWRQLDHGIGVIRIESDKTDSARMFRLNPGTTLVLSAWKQAKGSGNADSFVVSGLDGNMPDLEHLAAQLRLDLEASGITCSDLFEPHGRWSRFTEHALRHSYVTRNLARGVPEDHVRQRTGHKSNELQRYRDAARSVAELSLDDVVHLKEAIPEFAQRGP